MLPRANRASPSLFQDALKSCLQRWHSAHISSVSKSKQMTGEESMAQEPQEEVPKRSKKEESNILANFSKIVKDCPKVRAKSGAALIRELAAKNGGAVNETELKYVLKRLIRGLGAGKNTSRIGFYSVFSTLLQTPRVEVDIEEVLQLLDTELHTSKNNAKSENADILTGQVLVCGSILRSGNFKSLSVEHQKKIVEMLVHAGKKKSYLSLPSYVFLVNALSSMTAKEFEKSVLSVLKPELIKPLSDYTLDNLYFLLGAHDKFPEVISKKFFKEAIGQTELINQNTIGSIADILLSVLPIKQILKHPVYELTCKKVAETDCIPGLLERIDEVLQKPTIMRIHVATIMLTVLVKNSTDSSLLPQIYTRNYLLEIISHLKTLNSKNQDHLQLAIYELFNATVESLKREDVKEKHKIAVLKRLLFYPGSFIFEKLTRSKVMQQIVATLNADGVKKLCKIYKGVMLAEVVKQRDEEGTETWFNVDRIYASQLMVKLLNHGAVRGEIEWKKEQLTVLMEVWLFKDEEKYGNVGNELAGSLKDTFFHALDLKMSKLEDLRSILSHLVHHINEQINPESYSTAMRYPFTESSYELWCKTIEVIDKFENKHKKNHLYPVFHTLFLNLVLQIMNTTKLATDSLNELFSCYEKSKMKKKIQKQEVEDGGDDIQWIEVVVDLFLNLLSHNSHLLRSLINRVFPLLCKDLTANALHQILSVLDPKSSDNPLSLRGEESDDEDLSDEESLSGDEEEEEEEEVEDAEETVNDKLRQAVSDALGMKGADTDEESVDMDTMSDSECEKLNSALGEAFKRFKPNQGKKSRKQSKDDEILTHFRIRVLDLIDLYIESPDVSMIYCLEIMLPLLQTLEFSVKENHQKPLQARVRCSLKKLLNIKKFSSVEGVDETVLCDLLTSLLEKGTKTALLIQEIGDKISECCIFTIRCTQYLCNLEETSKKTRKKLKLGISKILLEAQDTFFDKRDCLLPYVLFKSVMGMTWEKTTDLLPSLVTHAFNEEVRPFRRRQALELLGIFYKNLRLLRAYEATIKTELVTVEETLQQNTLDLFNNPQPSTKEHFICYLLTLLVTVYNSPVKTGTLDWDSLGKSLLDYASRVVFTRQIRLVFNKLCSSLKISNAVTMKPNLIKLNRVRDDVDDEASQTSGKKGKKQRASVEMKKLKKQTHLLRLQSLSEGFGDVVSFSKADMNGIVEVEEAIVMNGGSKVKVNGKRSLEGDDVPKKKKLKK